MNLFLYMLSFYLGFFLLVLDSLNVLSLPYPF